MNKRIVIYSICFILFFLYTYEFSIDGGLTYVQPFRFLMSLIFLSFGVVNFIKRHSYGINRKAYRKTKAFWFIVFFAFLPIVFSIFWMDFDSLGLRVTILFLLLGVFAFDFGYDLSYSGVNDFLNWFILFTLFMALVGIFVAFKPISIGPIQIENRSIFRISAWLRSSNHFANYVGVGFIMALYQAFFKREWKAYYFSASLVLFISLLLAGSRGALISAVLCIIIFLLFSPPRVQKRFLLITPILIPVSLICFVAVLGFVGLDMEVFKSDVIRVDQDVTENERFDIWDRTYVNWSNGAWQRKIFGFGRGMAKEFAGRSTHNTFVSYIINYGFIMFFMFMFLIIRVIYHGFSKLKHNGYLNLLFLVIIMYLVLRSLTNNGLGSINFQTFLLIMVYSFYSSTSKRPIRIE